MKYKKSAKRVLSVIVIFTVVFVLMLSGINISNVWADPTIIIATVAGGGSSLGDGGPATSAQLYNPYTIAFDNTGNMYIVDARNNRIRKVDTSGNITTVAGTGTAGYSGDGGNATNAMLNFPTGVACDNSGNLYIADFSNNRIRKVAASGVITTVAGNGTGGYSGDGGAATSAKLYLPAGIAIDAAGNYYITDMGNNRIRKVNTSGVISTVAGNGTGGYSGDGGTATSASISSPIGLTVDGIGNIYIGDSGNNRIRKVDTSGTITTVAGNGTAGYSGDNGSAVSAGLNGPIGIAVDNVGNMYIADRANNRIRKVDTSGVITTVAGTGTAGFSGDDGVATSAQLNGPCGITIDGAGNLYVGDYGNNRIRFIGPDDAVPPGPGGDYYYVSITGDDSNPGTQAQPFRTINHAAQVAQAGDTVIIGGGTYRETVIPAYSGKAGSPITYEGAEGENVIINGCDVITGWSSYSGSIYQASMPWTMGKGKDQVFVDGNVLVQARYPQTNTEGKSYPVKLSPLYPILGDFTAVYNSSPSQITSSTLLNQPDNYWTGVIYNGGHGWNWSWQSGVVASSTNGSLTIGQKTTGWWFNLDGYNCFPENQQGYLTDNMNCLTYAGAWQNQNNILYLWTSDGSNPSGHMVEAKKRQLAFDLRYKNYININRINVFACSMTLYNANNCIIDDCEMSYVSHFLLWDDSVSGYDDINNQTVNGAPQQGRVGVYIGGVNNIIRNSTIRYSAGSGLILAGCNITVTNNNIHDCGFYATQSGILVRNEPTAGAYAIRGGHTITYNNIYNMGKSAINLGGNLYACEISYNRIHDTCILAQDGGAIYSFGVNLNMGGTRTQVHNNLIYNQWGKYWSALCYADNNTYGIDYHDNVLWNDPYYARVSLNNDGYTCLNSPGDATFTNNMKLVSHLKNPYTTAFDSSGNMYITDTRDNCIRKVDTSGIITTAVGMGKAGYGGDGGAATSAMLNFPTGVACDNSGNLYIADFSNNRIRKVNASGIITTVAGTGTGGYSGDGGAATSAQLNLPAGIAVDSVGNLYISDMGNNCIRKVTTSGVITTVAGNGTLGYSGDGGVATNAGMNSPIGITVDGTGNLYIGDSGNNRIRKVDTSGIINTVAGNGTAGYSGDNGAAVSAGLNGPTGVAVDNAGNLYFADRANNRIRKVDTSGVITTIVGKGTAGYSGDNGTATSSELYGPCGITVDSAGNLYVGDYGNNRIRMVNATSGIITTVAGNYKPENLTQANYPNSTYFFTGSDHGDN